MTRTLALILCLTASPIYAGTLGHYVEEDLSWHTVGKTSPAKTFGRGGWDTCRERDCGKPAFPFLQKPKPEPRQREPQVVTPKQPATIETPLTPVPVPAGMALLLTALGALAMQRRAK